MKVLGIETSCDETAAAVVADGVDMLSNVVASQTDIHAQYGGVVPEVAARQHLLCIVPVLQRAMAEAQVGWADLDAVAATYGPGLAGSLLVGVNFAKAIAFAHHLPLVGVNHLEGHIYANWLVEGEPSFPLLCLVVSGGHSDLILMKGHGQYQRLGRTRDDAAGEAFDKVARILGLGYPGGPAIQRVASQGGTPVRLPRAWLGESYDFSFSGLKTAVLRLVGALPQKAGVAAASSRDRTPSVAEVAAGFQASVVEVLVEKTRRAAEQHGVGMVLLAGGVASNLALRQAMTERITVPVRFPPPVLCTDNAAMVASCGYFRLRSGATASWALDIAPSLRFT